MTDLLIVGGGVLGAFHAYHALKRGLSVTLLEQHAAPQGATVRNFGQVVPSGMPQGKWQRFGLESTRIYKELQAEFDISVRQNGTVYLASDEAELGLLEELHAINQDSDYTSTSALLTKRECLTRYPGLRADYCRGGLSFPEEVTVEPRTMIHRVLGYLQEQLGLEYRPGRQVIACDPAGAGVRVRDAYGELYQAERVIICSGWDFKTLYPEVFAASELEVCKLQMLQTVPQPGLSLPGSVLTGLTIRRYESFRECPSYAKLSATPSEIHADPRLSEWGVHILLKQALDGSIILGDSHEYRDAAEADALGFDLRSDVNALMVHEAQKIFDLPAWDVAQSWAGFYTQCKNSDIFCEDVAQGVRVVTGVGGKGMTASAGFAREHIQNLFSL